MATDARANTETFGTTSLATNTWTRLATTYDGATLRLYVNGVQVSSKAKTGTILTSTNPLQLGGDSIYGQYFQGVMDEVRVYNMALTQAQIQTDMNTPISTTPPTAPRQLGCQCRQRYPDQSELDGVDQQHRSERLPGRAARSRHQ